MYPILTVAGFRNIQSLVNQTYIFRPGLNVIKTPQFENNVGKSILFKCMRILTGHPRHMKEKLDHIITYGKSKGIFWLEASDDSIAGFELTRGSQDISYFYKAKDKEEAEWLSSIPTEFLNNLGFMIDDKTKFTLNIADPVTGRLLQNVSDRTLYGALEMITDTQELNDFEERVDNELELFKDYKKNIIHYQSRFKQIQDKNTPKDVDRLKDISERVKVNLEYLERLSQLLEAVESISTIGKIKDYGKIQKLLEYLESLNTIIENLRKIKPIKKVPDFSKEIQYMASLLKIMENLQKITILSPLKEDEINLLLAYLTSVNKIYLEVNNMKKATTALNQSVAKTEKLIAENAELLKEVDCPIKGKVVYFESGCV